MVDRGAIGFRGIQGPATTPTAKPKAQPFKDPRGGDTVNIGVIDQSLDEGFPTPPTVDTHPTALNVAPSRSTPNYKNITKADVAMLPTLAPLWQAQQKQNAPSQEQMTAMQASQRAMAILKAAPSLKTHPDIVAALAYNTGIPFTPETIKMIAVVQRARSAVDYSAKFTMEDYNQTAHLVDPQAFETNDFWDRLGKGFSKTIGYAAEGIDSVSRFFSGDAQTGPRLSPLSQDPVGAYVAKKGHEVATGINKYIETSPLTSASSFPEAVGPQGQVIAASLPPVFSPAKPILQFAADQFDTPEHLYRYIATVQHKYGYGYAALALMPVLAGAFAGAALG